MSGSDLNGAKTPPVGSAEMNAVARAEFAKQGDDGTTRRPVDHFAFPSSETASPREDVLTWAKNCGFTAVEMEDGWVQFGHVDAIVGEAFDTITQDIGDALSAIGWTYDGWDCEAVSADNAVPGEEE